MLNRLTPHRSALPLVCLLLIGGGIWFFYSVRFDHSDRRKHFGTAYAARIEDWASLDEMRATQRFEQLLQQHGDLSYEELLQQIGSRDYLKELPFVPRDAKHFAAIERQLALTPEEVKLYQRNGFVSCDLMRRYGFAAAYYEVFRSDLPVLITTDSILHAMHRSFDTILMEQEALVFAPIISDVLAACHEELEYGYRGLDDQQRDSVEDVDLYLTLARTLLKGQPVAPKFVSVDKCKEILDKIDAEKIEVPDQDPPTAIYGGMRYIDYSQFKPRGHYTSRQSPHLRHYFRCMMWLGRADTGWYLLPPSPFSSIVSDTPREQRNAVLLGELLERSGALPKLTQVDDILGLFVGRSDNLRPTDLLRICLEVAAPKWHELNKSDLQNIEFSIAESGVAEQMIRSQTITSPSNPLKIPPPCLYQLFGQRFAIDAFALSHVVFDSIVYQGKKQKRMMPRGLDVMAVLGNNEAIPLLKQDLQHWNYSTNLLAARTIVEEHDAKFWDANLYHTWLNALRTLDEDHSDNPHFPAVMKTQTWQQKQLQTQLASWAELRHDTILYAKQSYTGMPGCEYPDAYVEPYPEFYGTVKQFAQRAAGVLLSMNVDDSVRHHLSGHVSYFNRMSEIAQQLETISQKQLAAQPLADEENDFLERVVDKRGNIRFGSGRKAWFDGWYCELLYRVDDNADWAPVIADVHTNPRNRKCLEVGTGGTNMMVIAVDNEDHLSAYVGPVFSYYEFEHPAEKRLTDEQWIRILSANGAAVRPEWVRTFQAPAAQREDP